MTRSDSDSEPVISPSLYCRYGTFLFNNLVTPPPCVRPPITLAEGQYQPLRTSEDAQEALDETAALPADLGTSGYDVVPTSSRAGKARRD